MKRIKLTYLLIIIALLSFQSIAQQSIGFGLNSFHSIGLNFMRYGLHASLEQPRNEVNTFFLRGTYTLPVKFIDSIEIEKDFSIDPQVPGPSKIEALILRKTTLLSVEGGTRYYLLNTYDAGTTIYGGFHMKGYVATYKEELKDNFEVPTGYIPINRTPNQTSVLLSFGANIGFKYHLPMGNAINIDFVGDLIRALHDPAFILGNEVLPLAFSLNISYRFDQF